MRLLECQTDGSIRLTDNLLDKDVSQYQYAILSHRWGPYEVTFEDMLDGSGSKKAGYEKIKFCGEQAALDGLKYFWVDSCCIKKSSDAELSEAINSMYRWYSRAAKCYVYLSDVSNSGGQGNASQPAWSASFRTSEWFSRGWTLQELIAPSSVDFFSRNRTRLGDRSSLGQQIHEITGIALSALSGTPLSHFSVDERFKWAQNRNTTREEDWAYCLLGIFDISMPVIYGEGRERAVNRLRKEINEALNNQDMSTSSNAFIATQNTLSWDQLADPNLL
ncbi:heterokaryon incompatibility protein-domain-containing protein [Leptodontidium sp. 2 PMI_412]|nr:heterokaryon incompatibility protein-domain-containing protein [Leptodontidium sp. 2 PMI_412]